MHADPFTLSGKAAVIVGGSSGIGAATVLRFVTMGAKVVVADVDAIEGSKIVDLCRGLGGEAEFIHTDILDEAQIRSLMSAADERFGHIGILVNSAGLPRAVAPEAEIIELPVEWWNKTISGHLTGTMLACKYALPYMKAKGGGAIVNVSSLGSMWATMDLPAYSVSKAGVNQLAKEIAAAYGRDGIRCNSVAPGAVLTPRGRTTMGREMFELFARESPLTRLPEADDIANVIAFLACDAAAMLTGQTITIDGGLMTKLPYWLYKMRSSRGESFDATTPQYSD